MSTYIGQRFGDYYLVHSLGEGTYGDVYYAEHVHQKTLAAVKVFKTKLTPDKFKTFINEARTVLLKHPNIVPIIDFGVRDKDDLAYLVMEYAPNGTFLDRHPRGTLLPLHMISAYVNQIASALQYAHDNRCIHRDIKPANVLFGTNNKLLLSDFGLVVVAHTAASQRIEDVAGSPAYMAPEQWRGQPLPESDQYALGIMVYQWLCGDVPFIGRGMEQIMWAHMQQFPPSFKEKGINVAPAVENVIMKALSKDPAQRFENVQTFSDALEWACQLQQSAITTPFFSKKVILRHQSGSDFVLQTDESQTIYVPGEPLKVQLRPPLNLAWILDQSSTMEGKKLQCTKEAMKMVIDHLQPTDHITVITFDEISQIIIPSTQANNPVKLKAAVDCINIRKFNTTNRIMSKGVADGLNELRRRKLPNAVSRIILLTDGVTNGDADLCRQLSRDAATAGVSIFPLGIGSDWDEGLLDDIGQLSGGLPASYIPSPADIITAFLEQII